MLLERGEELSAATADAIRSASATIELRLLDDSPPLREGQIVHVRAHREGRDPAGAIVLCRQAGDFRLVACRAGRAAASCEILGRVVAVQRGPTTFPIEHGLLSRLPMRWLSRAVDALEVLTRFRHPLTPPLSLGSAEASLAAVRRKYGRAGEVHRYSSLAAAAAEAFELELVERHVRPGGSILDIGCGAGREAIGFARAGFRILPVIDPEGSSTGRQVVTYCLALLVVGLLPTLIGLAGPVYFIAACVLGLVFLGFGIDLARSYTVAAARRLLFASLVYLPLTFLLMALDKVPPL